MLGWMLALLCGSAGASGPRWTLNVSTNGKLDLGFVGGAAAVFLKDGCPSVRIGAPPHVSLCDPKKYDTVNRTNRRGHDARLGNYTEHVVMYHPVDPAAAPAAGWFLRLFDPPSTIATVQLRFKHPVVTNFASPLEAAQWSLGERNSERNGGASLGHRAARTTHRILHVPQDNDLQSEYAALKAGPDTEGTSSFVSAFFDEFSRAGLVIGFLEHDLWKSGVAYSGATVSAIVGVNGLGVTRDTQPHGMVSTTETPWLSLGVHPDWRDGLEAYADMQLAGGVPATRPPGVGSRPLAGWNSWAMAAAGLGQPNHTNMFAASDVLETLRSAGFGPTQFITRDAVDNLNASQNAEWIDHVRAQPGQHAGSYDSPWVWYSFGPQTQQTVQCDGTSCNDTTQPGCFVVNDTLVKDKHGRPIASVASRNKFIRDVTHPLTQCTLKRVVEEYIAAGYTLIKEDFLNLAATEGERMNMSAAPTGMAAYNIGLKLLADAVAGRAIIDYGISLPLPVGPAGHARHQGCEQMYGGVEYGMNQFAGGWWLNGLYSWLDPDLVALQGDYWFRKYLANATRGLSMDSKSRVAKAVVYGGLFKSGDDLSNATNAALTKRYLGNPRVNAMWGIARAGNRSTMFRPTNWEGGIIAPPVFTRRNGDVAVFNYAPEHRTFSVDLKDAGLRPTANTRIECENAWDGNVKTLRPGTTLLAVAVLGGSSELLACRIHPHRT